MFSGKFTSFSNTKFSDPCIRRSIHHACSASTKFKFVILIRNRFYNFKLNFKIENNNDLSRNAWSWWCAWIIVCWCLRSLISPRSWNTEVCSQALRAPIIRLRPVIVSDAFYCWAFSTTKFHSPTIRVVSLLIFVVNIFSSAKYREKIIFLFFTFPRCAWFSYF